MDPEVRSLFQISLKDALLADEIFETLMGDDVAPRKEFIVKNAKNVKSIDA
jgi:DNA gyrase subunit B